MTMEQEIDQLQADAVVEFVRYRRDLTEANFPPVIHSRPAKVVSLAELSLSTLQWIYCGDVVEAIARSNLIAGTLADLCRFAPRWNRQNKLVALGSIWRESPGNHYVGCLRLTGQGSELAGC